MSQANLSSIAAILLLSIGSSVFCAPTTATTSSSLSSGDVSKQVHLKSDQMVAAESRGFDFYGANSGVGDTHSPHFEAAASSDLGEDEDNIGNDALLGAGSRGNQAAQFVNSLDGAEAAEARDSDEDSDADDDEGSSEDESRQVLRNWPANLNGQDSNIANARILSGRHDMATAAGHHHHKKHHVHGKMDMGAHTGKKGSFGWHTKHPVGKGKK